ncbi:MAG: glycine oxidase ThiO [Cytophagaceae bacterium]|nr:glycine oxidase ThiO [Gemmatimonadaceae bacterium]
MLVIVVGTGVIGCAVAWELATRGASVRLLDQREVGAGASWASAGVLCPWLDGSYTALTPMLAESSAMYEGLLARLTSATGRTVEFRRNGTLEVALTENELPRLEAIAHAHAKHGVPHALLSAAQAIALEPALNPGACGAVHVPAHGYVDVPALVQTMADAAERAGARIRPFAQVLDLGSSGSGVLVTGADETWSADAVVLATGAWSGRLSVSDAAAAPVRPIRGQLLRFRGTSNPTHSMWSAHGYLVPWSDGTVLVGATHEDVGFDESNTDDAIASLTACAREMVPSLADAPLIDARAGLRPYSADGMPIIGRSSSVPGLTWATGHGRNGVMLAPLTARMVADLVLEGRAGAFDALSSPTRFGL